MSRSSFAAMAAAASVVLWAAACGEDQRGDVTAPEPRFDVQEGAQALTDYAGGELPVPTDDGGAQAQAIPQSIPGLTFFTDRPTFNGVCSSLPVEDFEEGVGVPGGFAPPLDQTTNNGIFSPGDILPGMSIRTDNLFPGTATDLRLVKPADRHGSASKLVVANFFVETYIIDFAPGVGGVGADVVTFQFTLTNIPTGNTGTCNIDIYGSTGLLGSTTATCSPAGSFWGVNSVQPITRIEVFDPGSPPPVTNNSEGFDNIAFGSCNPPDEESPATTSTAAVPNPVAPPGSNVDLTANVDDTNTGGSNIASAEYSLDGGAFMGMVASDGTFDEVSEDVEASFNAPAVAGDYDLCVRGTDDLSNMGDSECITLVVPTPDEQVEDLGDAVEDLLAGGTINNGEANALTATLDAVLASLDSGNTNAATGQLDAFINKVNAMVNSGRLTPEEGQALIDAAQAAIDTINNGS